MEEIVAANLGLMLEGELRASASNSLDYSNLEAAAKKADISVARQYRNSTCLMKKSGTTFTKYPICSTSLEEIGEYGSGIELYFKLVKSLCFAFFIISCISAYPIYLNSEDSGLVAGEIRQRWDTWAVSNSDIVYDSSDRSDNEALLFRKFICDAVYTGFFIIFIVVLQKISHSTVEKNFRKNVTLADYSIEVKGFPEYDSDKESVKKHFEQFGQVHEVFLARRYNGMLKIYSERALISNELAYYNLQKSFGKRVDRRIAKLKKKIFRFDEQIKKNEQESVKAHDELPVIRGFVVFKDLTARKKCFVEYQKDRGCCKRLRSQSTRLKYKGIFPLRLSQTAAPQNILFENIEVTKCSRILRRIVSLFCVVIVLIASITMVYSLKMYQDDLPSRQDCEGIDKSLSLEDAKYEYESKTDKYCYCKRQKISDIINDSDMFDYCTDFVKRISTTVSIRIGVSFGVIFVNFLIKIIFRVLGKYERVANKSQEQLKLMSKVFLATFINTGLVILAVNADFSELRTESWMPRFIFNSDFEDFSRLWYVEVGSTIVSTMLISIFSPHCVLLLTFYPLGLCKRHCCTGRYVTQAEANLKFSGAEFDLATRNSFVLTVVFTCFLYSGGMPILNVICCLTMFVLYWVDKFLLLRHYKKPPMYNHLLHERVLHYLPYACILHCGFSLYMYGASDIFPMDTPYDDGTFKTNTIGDRIMRITGIVNIILIGCAILSIVWIYFYAKIFLCLLKRRKNQVEEEKYVHGSIDNEIEFIRAHGLDSYDVRRHPEYRQLIKSMNSSAIKPNILDVSGLPDQ